MSRAYRVEEAVFQTIPAALVDVLIIFWCVDSRAHSVRFLMSVRGWSDARLLSGSVTSLPVTVDMHGAISDYSGNHLSSSHSAWQGCLHKQINIYCLPAHSSHHNTHEAPLWSQLFVICKRFVSIVRPQDPNGGPLYCDTYWLSTQHRVEPAARRGEEWVG